MKLFEICSSGSKEIQESRKKFQMPVGISSLYLWHFPPQPAKFVQKHNRIQVSNRDDFYWSVEP